MLADRTVFAVIGTGGSAAPFLRAGAGARAAALSGAFTAFSDDASCAYWNPAATGFLEKNGISSMFSWLSQDRRYNFFNLVIPTQAGSFGVNLISFAIGGIEARESDTEDFSVITDTENAYLVTYGKNITPWLAAGAGVKYIDVTLFTYKANGVSFDLAAMLRPAGFLSIGLALQDLSGSISWSTGSKEQLPSVLRLGVLLSVPGDFLRFSSELEQNSYEGVTLKQGVEAVVFRLLFLRGGVSYGVKSYEFNWTLGAGARYGFSGVELQADYALLREEFFGVSEIQHKLSLNVYF